VGFLGAQADRKRIGVDAQEFGGFWTVSKCGSALAAGVCIFGVMEKGLNYWRWGNQCLGSP
jgi:hypothetical protein